MIGREQALEILKKEKVPKEVIEHSLKVCRFALDLAEKIKANGHPVDINLVEIGSLLHDVGRSRVHGREHSIIGAEILRNYGLDERLIHLVENHMLAGIKKGEMGDFPEKDLLPLTIEEKIVSYADNCDGESEEQFFENLEKLKKIFPKEIISRMLEQKKEIDALLS